MPFHNTAYRGVEPPRIAAGCQGRRLAAAEPYILAEVTYPSEKHVSFKQVSGSDLHMYGWCQNFSVYGR